jgi:hypothetical protein
MAEDIALEVWDIVGIVELNYGLDFGAIGSRLVLILFVLF